MTHPERARPELRASTAGPAPAEAPVVRAGMPIELRALTVLLLLDLAIGIWMRLHAEGWVSFFATHLPVLGVAAAAWGVAPDTTKQWLGDRARAALGRRSVTAALATLVIGLGTASLFCSTVQIESVDPGARTRLRVVVGGRTSEDLPRLATAAAAPLNRLTSPIAFRVWMPPTGRRVWVYGAGLATASTLVLPWVPTRFQYPDDFDTLATLAAMPAPGLFALMGDSATPPILTVRDAADTTRVLAAAPLRSLAGLLLGFPEPVPADSATRMAWRDWLRGYFTDAAGVGDSAAVALRDAEVAGMLRRWAAARPQSTARPLIVGDLLRWELHRGGRLLRTDTTRMTRAITAIYLDVDPAPAAP